MMDSGHSSPLACAVVFVHPTWSSEKHEAEAGEKKGKGDLTVQQIQERAEVVNSWSGH